MDERVLEGRWALILGASSGFGAAAARALAGAGMHIFGVHLDRKATLPRAQQVIADVRALGREAIFFNTNAADARRRARVLDQIERTLAGHVATPEKARTGILVCLGRSDKLQSPRDPEKNHYHHTGWLRSARFLGPRDRAIDDEGADDGRRALRRPD